MKNYILSLITLLFSAAALVSCGDDFDDINVNYPEGFPMSGIWMSEYTNNDDSEYTAILNMKEGVPTLTVFMYGKSDDENAAGSYYVAFQSEEISYDAEVGQLTATGTSLWGTARVYLTYQSDLSKVTFHLEVYESRYDDWDLYCVSTLRPTDTLPLYGYMLEGTGAVDDATGESDGLYYRIILNSPDRKSVAYGYFGAASSRASALRTAELVDFYYSVSGNTYTLVSTENEQMVLTLNDNFEPVLKFRGKTIVLDFGNHILTEKEFAL